MDYVTRISVSLEPELLDRFDELISKKGYSTRSKAIADLIRDSVSEDDLKYEDSQMTGIIVLIYDKSVKDIMPKLSDALDSYGDLIVTRTTVPVSDGMRMIVIIADGKLSKLKKLASDATSVKGVLRGRMTLASPSTGNIHHIGLRE